MPRHQAAATRRTRPPATPPRRFAGFSKRALTTPRPDRTQKNTGGGASGAPSSIPEGEEGEKRLGNSATADPLGRQRPARVTLVASHAPDRPPRGWKKGGRRWPRLLH